MNTLRRRTSWLPLGWLAIASACSSGQISLNATDPNPSYSQSSPDNPNGLTGATAGTASESSAQTGTATGTGTTSAQNLTASSTALHRLNNVEYNNTVRDLLGFDSQPAAGFTSDEKAAGFDNIATALGMTEVQYQQYAQAAEALAAEVFEHPAARSRLMRCEPAAADPMPCVSEIVREFARRAYRRPLSTEEEEQLLALFTSSRDGGATIEESLQAVVQGTLSSASFLYRVAPGTDPASNAYVLASRLAYFLWSSMPDDTLLDLARDGTLMDQAVLTAQVERMLNDSRASALTQNFAGQWLGLRSLQEHQVSAEHYPGFSEALRADMVAEGFAFFDSFLHGSETLDSFFTSERYYVGTELAQLYGAPTPTPGTRTTVEQLAQRRGFLGLASFLTQSSFSYRTAPTLRGKWVLENLLCTVIPPPPVDVPELDGESGSTDTESLNVRERLAEHRSNPQCAACHRLLDPIGLGLENFDAIGAYRDRYDNGDLVDASGELPSGDTFDGLMELSTNLAKDPRLTQCASEKLFTYALGRELQAADRSELENLRQDWEQQGLGLRELVHLIVQSDAFAVATTL